MRRRPLLALLVPAFMAVTPSPATAATSWAERADGFAGLSALGVDGTTGGAAGRTVTAGGTVLIAGSRLEGDTDRSVSLGRSGDGDGSGARVVVRDSWLGAQVKDDPWEGEGWFAEYRNTGPGAAVTPDRPQLTDDQARAYTVRAFLRNWTPPFGT